MKSEIFLDENSIKELSFSAPSKADTSVSFQYLNNSNMLPDSFHVLKDLEYLERQYDILWKHYVTQSQIIQLLDVEIKRLSGEKSK